MLEIMFFFSLFGAQGKYTKWKRK